jgi:hypothetical protein
MARRIYIKDGGLNTSSTIPPGYTAIGTDSGDLKKKVVDTISDIGGGGSSKTRVDVVSIGVKSEYGLSTFTKIAPKSGSENLLWEVVDSNGNYLISDQFYNDMNDLNIYVNAQSLNGIDMTVKGYYYLDQSKEKFRIVGRNLSYWSLVGLNNYARMRQRGKNNIGISPGTLGQSIINALQTYSSNTGYESLAYINNDGKGLAFSSMKGDKICKNHMTGVLNVSSTMVQEFIKSKINLPHNTFGIDDLGNLVPLYELTFNSASYTGYNECLLLSCTRNGGVQVYTGDNFDSADQPKSLLQICKFVVFTDEYPNTGPGLIVWYVAPIGQDIFLLNNNSSILSDDDVYLIPETMYSTFFPKLVSLYNTLDDIGFGEDLSNDTTKTGLDRYRNIRVEDIPSFDSNNKGLYNTYNKSIKWRVAYGKLGNFTLSDDYVIMKSRLFNANGYIAKVNKY